MHVKEKYVVYEIKLNKNVLSFFYAYGVLLCLWTPFYVWP